jgi:hypothetical protein
MTKTRAFERFGYARALAVVLAVASVAGGCAAVDNDAPPAQEQRSALATSNGLALNGLTTNGLWANGLWANGLWANGLWANGLWANGLWANGLWANGLWANGLWANGLWANGLWANGLWANGLWANGLWANGLTGTAAIPGDTIRNSSYARQLLQYIYACAMPGPTTDASGTVITQSYDTSLDPNNGALTCSTSSGCAAGYSCSAGKCVVPLKGMIGLGINSDGSGWWESGSCDESCQRWVSSCVLARTNAYGVHVQISMRAPAVTPLGHELQYARIRAALATSPSEVADFSFREGAYYGNIFATTPIDPSTGLAAVYPGTDGPATGPIASTPSFYACAGPDSNVPQITKRFCSSQGDQSVINVPGVCWPPASGANVPPVCDGIDGSGSIYGCYTSADATKPRTHYDEVVTVYLKQPIAVCGDDVCDAPAESSTSCPSDCHPTGWAKSFAGVISGSSSVASFDYHGSSAVSPVDDSIVLAGLDSQAFFANLASDLSLGGPLLPGSDGNVVVAKYSAKGDYLWGKRWPSLATRVEVIVTSDGRVVVGEWGRPGNVAGSVSQLTPDGQLGTDAPVLTNDSAGGSATAGSLAADATGNVIMSGYFNGTLHFKTGQGDNHTFANAGTTTGFVLKIRPSGVPAWGTAFGGTGTATPTSLAIDPSGDVLLAAALGDATGKVTTTNLYRLASATGALTALRASPPWSATSQMNFAAAAANGTGDFYATGSFMGTYDFGPGCGTATTAMGSELFLAKYSADGSQCRWVTRPAIQCPPGAKYCSSGLFQGGALAFDHAGNVVVGGRLDPLAGAFSSTGGLTRGAGSGAVVDFGAGPFEAFTYPDAFVATYGPGGAFVWATQIEMILMGNLRAMNVDRQNNVVVSGTYTGSMEVDDRLLIDTVPELVTDQSANTYLASFAPPSALDQTPPVIGAAVDTDGTPISTIPNPIYMEATSASGTAVYFNLPTATDAGGVTVSCAPPPNSTFPIGTTLVTCTATDGRGNKSTATFTVTVVDHVGPAITAVAGITIQAPNASGAIVTYTPPTSTDQIDGVRPVTCLPASGSLFAIGKTTVTCSATDRSNNLAQTTFIVNVLGLPFGAACTSTAQCASGSCVDGVCCNTPAPTCGQCYACNVPGSVGICTATSGGSCSDGNACTTADTCNAGVCVAGPPLVCNDQNVCTVDSCNPASGCVYAPGNAGTVCRAAASACDTAELCTGTSASCGADVDQQPPVLGGGADQVVVGTCVTAPLAFSAPSMVNGTCEAGTTVTCTSIPGNSYGAHPVTCTAKDASGNVSAPVTFTITVLQPLTVRIQPPLAGDNNTVDNVVKSGSTVPNKIQLFACGVNVTTTAPVVAKLAVAYTPSGGTAVTADVPNYNGKGDVNGLMVLDGANYRYNLDTKGYSTTASSPGFYQETITVAYKSAPNVVVASDAIQFDTK